MGRAATKMAKVSVGRWFHSLPKWPRRLAGWTVVGAAAAMVALGEYAVALGVLFVALLAFTMQIVDWRGFPGNPKWTNRYKLLAWMGAAFMLACFAVIFVRIKGTKEWSNFAWTDAATVQSYLTYSLVISWRWLTIIVAIVVAFLAGRLFNQQSVPETRVIEPPTQQDEWLHKKLETDKATIKDLVWVASIFYWPEFDKSQSCIEFVFNVFNNSLFDVVINMNGGYVLFGDDNEQFYFDPKFIAQTPALCKSRDTTNFVVRQAVTQDEIAKRFKDSDNTRISFGNLLIDFSGTEQFAEIRTTPLDVNHYLFTAERAWRNPNRPNFLPSNTEPLSTEMSKRNSVGLKLKTARAALGLTIPELREKINQATGEDVGESTIRDIEKGRTPNPGFKTLEVISLGVGLNPLEVIGLGLNDPPDNGERE